MSALTHSRQWTHKRLLMNYANIFLGKDWCDYSGVTHPEQVNVNIVCAIEKQYKGAKLKRKVIYE